MKIETAFTHTDQLLGFEISFKLILQTSASVKK